MPRSSFSCKNPLVPLGFTREGDSGACRWQVHNSIALLHSDCFHGASDFSISHYRRHEHLIIFRTSTIFTSHMLVSCAHEQKAQCIHWWALSIGVATMANKKALFMTLVDCIPQFDAHWSHFFAEFDWFVVLTSRLDAYISRYGDFCANDNDNDNDNDTTDYFTPLRMRAG